MPPKATPKPTAKPAATATKPAAKPAAPTAKPAAKAAAGKAATPAPKTAAAPQAKQSATSSKAVSGNGVHIKGLTKESVADVKALFASAGNVSNVRLRRRKFALVWFDSAAGATKAVQQFNGKQHNGKQLAVHAAKAQPKPDKATTAVSIFVSPIFRQTTSRTQLRTLFADCGKITRVRQYRHNYAFIRFDSNAAVQNALKQKNGKQFFNKTLVVKASVRK